MTSGADHLDAAMMAYELVKAIPALEPALGAFSADPASGVNPESVLGLLADHINASIAAGAFDPEVIAVAFDYIEGLLLHENPAVVSAVTSLFAELDVTAIIASLLWVGPKTLTVLENLDSPDNDG